MKHLNKIFSIMAMLCLFGCDDVEYDKLTFIGDSIVARWDLEESFPSYYVENKGISGSGIDSFSQYENKFAGQKIVVIIGTNDLYRASSDEDMTIYADEYIDKIIATGAKKIYLYSILPRNFESDPDDVNTTIQKLNECIKQRATSHKSIVYINAFEAFLSDGNIEQQYSYDGLHLSPYGYEILSNLLNEKLCVND